MGWPAAEIEVDEDLIRALLREQHPDLARLPLEDIGAGWDNVLWRLGDGFLVRLPRRATAAVLTENEQRWLPELARRLPLPVPAPERVGRPGGRYPWPWSVVAWLPGSPADGTGLLDSVDAAVRLGHFLEALHRPAPAEAPANPWRGVPLAERAAAFEERASALAEEMDGPATRRVWNRALAVPPWTGPPLWLHGDLHPANILVTHGTVSAVLDFGDLCAGDPATDLAGAWMALPLEAIPHFHAAYGGVDHELEMRSLGWALLFGLMLLGIGLDDRPTYETVGRSTLARVLARFEDIGE